MRPSALVHLYRRRLRAHGLQELLAAIGLTVAVALVFSAVISERSISTSAARVVHVVIGPASLQIRARSDEGFEESLLARVKSLPGVRRAAPLLEATASVTAPDHRQARLQLAGADLRLAVLDGLAETLPIGALSGRGIGLSRAAAEQLGIAGAHRGPITVTLSLRGRSEPLRLTAVLGQRQAGALAGAYAAVMPLARMQQLAGLRGRVSRIFVLTAPGQRARVRAELQRLAGAGLEVAPANEDIASLDQALGPSGLASGLFAAIGALLGFLLAFNAMLLTVAERRRTIADLRLCGAGRASIVALACFESLCLAVPASLLGVGAGWLLSITVFHDSTRYLAEAFTLSGQTVVQPAELLLALGIGIAATSAAAALPLLDLRRARASDAIYATDADPGHALGERSRMVLASAAAAALAGASGLWLALPSAAIAATALLALATVLALPLLFAAVLQLASAAAERLPRITILPLALSSLRATTIRSLALAATGAVALFGSIALGGARQNLLSGIRSFARSYVADASIWISNPGDNQAVESFQSTGDLCAAARDGGCRSVLSALPGVASVQRFQGGFMQLGARRVWVIARPPGADAHVLATQIAGGDLAEALAALRQGGHVVISRQIAAEHGVGIGGHIELPTPTGRHSFEIAATSTNLAWPPGVIFISAADYQRYWRTSAPTALGVQLRAGAAPAAAAREIEGALPRHSGLEVSLAAARARHIEALASEGLAQLEDVSTMLLIAAIIAMAAALASAIWQRRASLASLRILGARRASLLGLLLTEALLMLGAGCVSGAIAGFYGEVVIDVFLRHVTGFPLASPAASLRPLQLLALVLAAAIAASALPGALAARVNPTLALADE